MERLFSTTTLTFSVAQRDDVQQGTKLPLTAAEGWAWNGQLDFKPDALFITSTNWKNALSILGKGTDGTSIKFDKAQGSLEYRCFIDTSRSTGLDECEKAFARPRLVPSAQQGALQGIAAVLIPTFQLKALSQFDFIKQGGLLIESPLLQRSLKNLTFTWDLKHLIPSASDRITVATLYEQAKKTDKPASTASRLCLIRMGSPDGKMLTSYISVDEFATADSCKRIAVDLGGDRYGLGCAKSDSATFSDFAGKDNDHNFVDLSESQKAKVECWKTSRQ